MARQPIPVSCEPRVHFAHYSLNKWIARTRRDATKIARIVD
eukprot:COSAG02_NODE_49095_length_329_cov_0.673913_1_plen_40_part_01